MKRSLPVPILGSLVVSTLALHACASLFGIEDRPLVEEAGAGADVGSPDTADALDVRPSSWCERLQPAPDFCDDFDRTSPIDGWKNQYVTRPAALVIERADELDGSTATGVLVARLDEEDAGADAGLAISILTQQIGGTGPVRGVRLRARLRVRELAFGDNEVDDAGSAIGPTALMAALSGATVDPFGQGIGLAIMPASRSPGKQVLAIVQRQVVPTTTQSKDPDSIRLIEFRLDQQPLGSLLHEQYLDYEIAVGPRDVLETAGLRCDLVGAPPDGGVEVRAEVGGTAVKCAPAQGPLADSAWFAEPLFAAGAAMFGSGRIEVAFDGVAVNAL